MKVKITKNKLVEPKVLKKKISISNPPKIARMNIFGLLETTAKQRIMLKITGIVVRADKTIVKKNKTIKISIVLF